MIQGSMGQELARARKHPTAISSPSPSPFVPNHLHRMNGPLFVVVGFAESRRERERLTTVGFAGFFNVARVVFLPTRPLWTRFRREPRRALKDLVDRYYMN